MAHYAFLDENNIVVEVIVGKDESQEVDLEQVYGNIKNLRCKRTSYNTRDGVHILGGIPFRHNYAGIGYIYIDELDIFLAQKPYPSWILNTELKCWEPPVPIPSDSKEYYWNEETLEWTLTVPETPQAI